MRRIPLSRRSHVTGFQTIPSGIVEHESALERDFAALCTFQDAAVVITAQPVTICFIEKISARRYTPDFLVRWGDGRAELVEVKYRTDLRAAWPRLKPAFIAARSWAREHGAGFRIATERAIRGPRLDNARRLLPLRAASIDAALAERALTVVQSLPTPTFGRVVDTLGGDRAVALGTLWRLIARGELVVDLEAPIGLNTWIALT